MSCKIPAVVSFFDIIYFRATKNARENPLINSMLNFYGANLIKRRQKFHYCEKDVKLFFTCRNVKSVKNYDTY